MQSYKDLPLNLYHIQWKFRDEVRPRFGVMRGREFLMKDAYCFDLDAEAAQHAYNQMFVAYLRTFARMGLKAIPMRAETGPIGGDYSHEFIILADTGESEVFCDRDFLDMDWSAVDIDFDDVAAVRPGRRRIGPRSTPPPTRCTTQAAFEKRVPADKRLTGARHRGRPHLLLRHQVFRADGREVQGPDGKKVPVQMGSYGIGVSRLVGAIIEASHDEAGIIWPEPVAPFEVGLINLKVGDAAPTPPARSSTRHSTAKGVDVLYDDRDERAGRQVRHRWT